MILCKCKVYEKLTLMKQKCNIYFFISVMHQPYLLSNFYFLNIIMDYIFKLAHVEIAYDRLFPLDIMLNCSVTFLEDLPLQQTSLPDPG